MLKIPLLFNKIFITDIACLHDQNISGFFEGPAFNQQSEQFKVHSKNFDWLEKSRPSKKATFVLIM